MPLSRLACIAIAILSLAAPPYANTLGALTNNVRWQTFTNPATTAVSSTGTLVCDSADGPANLSGQCQSAEPITPSFSPPPSMISLTNNGDTFGSYTAAASAVGDTTRGDVTFFAPPFTITQGIFHLQSDTAFAVAVELLQPLVPPPVPITEIPIIMRATGEVSCSDSSGIGIISEPLTYASVSILAPNAPVAIFTAHCPGGPLSFDVNTTEMFPFDAPVGVSMDAFGDIRDTLIGTISTTTAADSFQAFADPTFQIDPSFPYASYFELTYSPGAIVPEPSLAASDALLGSISVAVWYRRRKSKPSL